MIIGVGHHGRLIAEAANRTGKLTNEAMEFAAVEECRDAMNKIITKGDAVFVKGSRGAALERLIDAIWATGECR